MRVGWVSSVQDRRIASFRYRVEAPMAGLQAMGHEAEIISTAEAETDAYDVVVFSKAYSDESRALARALKRRGAQVVFDICDNHFYNPFDLPKYKRAREGIREMISISDRVICSTPALANVLRDEVDGEIELSVIGDIVERFQSTPRPRDESAPLRLTWFGSHGSPNAPSGMTDLLLIREELEALASKRQIELTVCSNNQEKFERTIAPLSFPTRYVEWSLDRFGGILSETDAVVLPMSINPFTSCKTHNRLSTALYAGVPVVASGIESYREFDRYCTLDDWSGGLQAIVDGPAEERERALTSREHIDRRWTMEALSAQWEAALALPAKARSARRADMKVHGRLDAVARDAVTGWVCAPLNGDLLQVVLECDGEPVAVALADQPRDDLRAAGLPANCGFSLPLPSRLACGPVPHLTVRVLESGWIVGENPILIASDGRPSFAPRAGPAEHPSFQRDHDAAKEQRWAVEGVIAEQEQMLTAMKRFRRGRATGRGSALKRALLIDEAGDRSAAVDARIGLPNVLRGADRDI